MINLFEGPWLAKVFFIKFAECPRYESLIGFNIDFRIEVTTPIFDNEVRKQLRDVIEMQLKGNAKSRIIDKEQTNNYKGNILHQKDLFRSQTETYKYFKAKLNNPE